MRIPDKKIHPFYQGGLLASQIYFPIGSGTALFFKNGTEPRGPKKTACIEQVLIREIPETLVDQLNQRMLAQAEYAVFAGFLDEDIQKTLKTNNKPERFRIG